MITINVHPGMTISLGREGENLARKIIFNVSSWQAEYGDGKVSLVANKDGTEPYPCDITVDGSIVTWMITSSDTTQSGFGRCELHYIVGEVLVKSDMWRTYTADALGTPAPEPPEPQQAWVDKVLAAGQAAVDAAVNPPKIGDNGNWYVWDFEVGKYVDTGVAASGGGSGAVSSVNGKTGAVKLTAEDVGAISQDDLQDATNEVLAQAKASGEFDGAAGQDGQDGAPGKDGYTPVYGVDYGTPEQISGIAQSAAEILQPEVNQLKNDLTDLQTAKMDSYTIKTAMDSIAEPHTQYYLGEQTTVDIVLPDSADVGQIIMVCWYNGDTAATLSITGTMLSFDYTPSANTRSEINALWDGTYWAVLGNEMAVPSEVTK